MDIYEINSESGMFHIFVEGTHCEVHAKDSVSKLDIYRGLVKLATKIAILRPNKTDDVRFEHGEYLLEEVVTFQSFAGEKFDRIRSRKIKEIGVSFFLDDPLILGVIDREYKCGKPVTIELLKKVENL